MYPVIRHIETSSQRPIQGDLVPKDLINHCQSLTLALTTMLPTLKNASLFTLENEKGNPVIKRIENTFWNRYRAYKHDFSSRILDVTDPLTKPLVRRHNALTNSPLPVHEPFRAQEAQLSQSAIISTYCSRLKEIVHLSHNAETSLVQSSTRIERVVFAIMRFFDAEFLYITERLPDFHLTNLSLHLDSRIGFIKADERHILIPKTQEMKFADGTHLKMVFELTRALSGKVELKAFSKVGRTLLGVVEFDKLYIEKKSSTKGIIDYKTKPHALEVVIRDTKNKECYKMLLQAAIEIFNRETEFPYLEITSHNSEAEILANVGFKADSTEGEAALDIAWTAPKRMTYPTFKAFLDRPSLESFSIRTLEDPSKSSSWQKVLRTHRFFENTGRLLPK